MVVYPQPPEGQHLTPSPFVDALQSAIHEVSDIKAQQNVAPLAREQSTEKTADNNDILRRLVSIEERFGSEIAELKQVNAELKEANVGLRQANAGLQHDMEELRRDDNAKLKHDFKELRSQMEETNRAVLGDKVAINKIRRRVLLDMGRDQLATICGHKNWREWKDEKTTSTPGDDQSVQTMM
ncbi:hypothetical protein P692DRAFT_20837789, partial [Suillus brevipes Sb2]